MLYALLVSLLLIVIYGTLQFRSLRSIDPVGGFKMKLHIEPFTGFGKPEFFRVAGRVSKDAGLLSHLNAEFDIARITTRIRRNLRRFILPDMQGVRLEIQVAGVSRETTTDTRGKFMIEFQNEPLLPPGTTVFSVKLHPQEERFEAEKGLGQIVVPPESSRLGIISDIDDTLVWSHTGNKLRMVAHALFTSVSDLRPTPGMNALLSILTLGLRRDEANPVFYVSSSPANLHYKIHAFLRANRFPLGPLFLTAIGREPAAGFFNPKEFKTKAIQSIFEMFPKMNFIFLGDNTQADSEIYHQISQRYPSRVAATLIFERVPSLKTGTFLPPGQNPIVTALDAALVLYRKGLLTKEGIQEVVHELIAQSELKESFKIDPFLATLEKRTREDRVLFLKR